MSGGSGCTTEIDETGSPNPECSCHLSRFWHALVSYFPFNLCVLMSECSKCILIGVANQSLSSPFYLFSSLLGPASNSFCARLSCLFPRCLLPSLCLPLSTDRCVLIETPTSLYLFFPHT
ncbi:hypothetical protein CC1G_13612 [Coprinopsis cinerea okayama7|uniref:Uncharacterized protein n=1 Tax=Coprinopsis cinerea (strain Okayama-7 / 130 / ATCC MYA-4618 / FGSC 9003) TaxID=240176 RepID=D6RJW7_COPC7|nr:hypothetical protein CC1G_13612 [Coprinopsis cinerea okayama7\|eukprot:XP_002912079.1 hypothetical protein CC1G_13612 [Coprinopsis cinerea okayama7\